ncbi:MAG: ABC transporter substrate-binding protein [Candidatus Omnitrophica bacterium]|nr:ABC transporter substrate-binding protein [Candidatus Omnitrophota bacterium]
MKKAVIIILAVLICAGPSFAMGREIQRIISLSPSITEILYELGLEDKVVGVTDYCIVPDDDAGKSRIGCVLGANYEKILLLDPDLIIIPAGYDYELVDLFKESGIDYLNVSTDTIDGILRSIRQIGERTGQGSRAQVLTESIQARLDEAKRRATGRPFKKIMIVVEREEGSFDNMCIAGRNTFYDEILEILGAANICGEGGVSYPVISSEAVLRLEPDIIIEILPYLADNKIDTRRKEWGILSRVKAVSDGNVHIFNQEYACIPGPSFVKLLEDLEKVIEGDVSP